MDADERRSKECEIHEQDQIETVITWLYGSLLVLSGPTIIALIRGIGWLGTKIF